MTMLPCYRSHKKVWALKIKYITINDDGSAVITPEEHGYASFSVDAKYVEKHKPQEGGYYVQYEDGYQSWSPAKAFESGYTLI